MAKAIKSMDEVPVSPFEALKRAYIKRGYIPRYLRHRGLDAQRAKAAEPIDPGVVGEKKSLEKTPPESKSAKGPENLTELTEKSLDVLYEATTVFPFTLFPDTVTLDREKLTIAQRLFWRTATITSTPVGEIMSCEAAVGPFFGSIHFTFRFFTDNERTVGFLPRKAALEMQRLVHGYIIAHRREIDCSHIPKDELIELLTELGQGASS